MAVARVQEDIYEIAPEEFPVPNGPKRSSCSRTFACSRRRCNPAPIARAAPAGCQASWTNSAGGSWSTGSNWSTGSPPTADQNACITIGLSAPVLLVGQGAARSLTLGGAAKRDQLTLQCAALDLASDTIIADTGTIVETGGTHIDVASHATLTNHGSIFTSPGGSVEVAGNLTNASDGLLVTKPLRTPMVASQRFGSTVPACLPTTARLRCSPTARSTPLGRVSGAVLNNAGGNIQNSGSVTMSAGATLIEGAGAITGNAAVIRGGGLRLQGPGRLAFQLLGSVKVLGTVAAQQQLILNSAGSTPVVASGSLTNRGTITTSGSAVLSLPSRTYAFQLRENRYGARPRARDFRKRSQ